MRAETSKEHHADS